MNVFKFAYFTDLHLSPHAPASRKDNYWESVLSKLSVIKDICNSMDVQAVFNGGDFFHLKATKPYGLPLWIKLIGILQEFKAPIYTIVGNHDIKHDLPESLTEMPLGFLVQLGLMEILGEKVFTAEDFSVHFRGYHYISSGGKKGFPIPFQAAPETESFSIGLVHNFLGTSPFEKEPFFSVSDLKKCPHHILLAGHDHSDKGVLKIGNTYVVQPGSIARNVLSGDNLERIPKVMIITLYVNDRGQLSTEFSMARLPCIPASDCFNLDVKIFEDAKNEEINKVLGQLLQVDPDTKSVQEILAHLDITSDVRSRVEYFLSLAGVC